VSAPAEPIVSVPVADACCDLLELFAGVSDGRAGRGRDHPVAAVLALAAAAVVAGMRGYTAITGWVADVPPAILADLYLRSGAAAAPPPSKTTIWRILTDADAGAFDVAVGTWLMNLAGFTMPATASREPGEEDGSRALMQVRLDGKAVRGARDADGNQVRLLAALADPDAATSVVAAQAEVGVKTNEVPMAAVVLGQIDLNGKIVTADALHTVKATANHIHEHGGEFVFPVKENRQALFDALNALPWAQVPVACTATDKGHGRITTRTIQVLPAPDDLPFPHVARRGHPEPRERFRIRAVDHQLELGGHDHSQRRAFWPFSEPGLIGSTQNSRPAGSRITHQPCTFCTRSAASRSSRFTSASRSSVAPIVRLCPPETTGTYTAAFAQIAADLARVPLRQRRGE